MSTNEIKDPEVLRRRWFDQPLNVIELGGKIPDGNGAIIALMAIFPLYERYLDDAEISTGTKWEILLAQDLNLPTSPDTTDAPPPAGSL